MPAAANGMAQQRQAAQLEAGPVSLGGPSLHSAEARQQPRLCQAGKTVAMRLTVHTSAAARCRRTAPMQAKPGAGNGHHNKGPSAQAGIRAGRGTGSSCICVKQAKASGTFSLTLHLPLHRQVLAEALSVTHLPISHIQREQEHCPDGQCNAKYDHRFGEPGLIAILRVAVDDEQVQADAKSQYCNDLQPQRSAVMCGLGACAEPLCLPALQVTCQCIPRSSGTQNQVEP